MAQAPWRSRWCWPSAAARRPPPASTSIARRPAQIAELQALKRSLSHAERKLDSRLAVALRRRGDRGRGRARARQDRRRRVPAGRTEVDVRATAVDRRPARPAEARRRARASRVGASDSVRASIPLAALDEVGAWKDVAHVDVAAGAITHQAVVSEGDKAHAADLARTRHRVTGIGRQAVRAVRRRRTRSPRRRRPASCPPSTCCPGRRASGDEGTAMLEILHDLAPNAELGFATAFTSDASFAENIRALRFQAGCDVIVDDVLYFNEHPFQDGPIAQSVNAVTADGALYFSSAGNEGNTLDGTSGNYEGDFAASGTRHRQVRRRRARLRPGPGRPGASSRSRRTRAAGMPVTLFWADPLGASANDYDLYLLDAAGTSSRSRRTCRTATTTRTSGSTRRRGGDRRCALAVVKFSGADRYFQLSALRGRFEDSADGLVGVRDARRDARPLGGRGRASAPPPPRPPRPLPFDLEPGDPPNPLGPFPTRSRRRRLPERFTSDGPRRVFFEADGTPITPGDFSSTGGAVRAEARHHGRRRRDDVGRRLRAVLRHLGGRAARRRDRRARPVGQPGR